MTMPTLSRCALLAAAACALLPIVAQPQTYPAKPVRIVVPFAPGSIDVMARRVGAKMQEDMGQPVIVETRPGAGGLTGAAYVAQSEPDGYTIMMTASGPMIVAPMLLKKVPFDTLRDFTPITVLVRNLNILVASGALEAASVRDLIDYARRNPGRISYGSSGIGTNQHLDGELFRIAAGIDMTHIPYKSFAPVVQDLVGGRLQLAFIVYDVIRPLAASGKVKILGVTDARRSQVLPGIPTVAETLPAFQKTPTWTGGLFGPAGMPQAVLGRLHASLVKAINAPDVRERIEETGYQVIANTPKEFVEMLKADIETTARALKPLGIQLEEY